MSPEEWARRYSADRIAPTPCEAPRNPIARSFFDGGVVLRGWRHSCPYCPSAAAPEPPGDLEILDDPAGEDLQVCKDTDE